MRSDAIIIIFNKMIYSLKNSRSFKKCDTSQLLTTHSIDDMIFSTAMEAYLTSNT